MSDCRASLAALLGLVLLAQPAPGLAQGGPVQLIPGFRDGTTSSPAEPRPTEARPATTITAPPGVQIEQLGAVDPSGLGLMRETEGGLPRTFWKGTERAQIDRLVAAILPTPSPTALGLARRLLLSEADLPEGQGGEPGLFATRIDRLTAIGDPDSAYQLARLVSNNPAAASRAVDAAWLADRGEDACATVQGIPTSARDTAWSKAFAFCRALANDLPGANLQAGLLRERGEADPVFLALIAQLSGYGDNKPMDIKAPTPLQIAMLKAANKPVTAATVDAASPAGARLLAEIAAASPDIRLRAAERAYIYGAMPVENLRAVYAAVEVPAKDVAGALSAKSPAEDPRTRAALFQAVEGVPAGERAQALVTALQRLRSQQGGLDIRLAMAHLESLLGIKPAPENVELGGGATRLLLAVGQEALARDWDQQLQTEGRAGLIEAAREAVRLVPLFAIATGDRLEPADLRDWIDAWRAGGPVESFEARAVGLLSALQGLGREVPPDVWGRLAASGGAPAGAAPTGHRPSIATLQAMRAAAQGDRIGETIAYVLIALDGQSPAALEGDALATVLESLVRIGFEREARRLALEAVIGRGL